MTKNQNNTEILCEEILEDARREGKEIVLRAKKDAEAFLAGAIAQADRLRRERLDHAHQEAARRSELILATVPVETGRLRAARVEAVLESLREEACRQMLARKGLEYREAVIAIASHAISQMAGAVFVAKVPDIDRTILGDGLSDEIVCRVGRPVSVTVLYEPDITEGGVVVEDAEARQVWDNRLAKRLERLWPELRRQIAVQAGFVPAQVNIDVETRGQREPQ
jgi:vacuolar-type H+-ATPase subunit E/Vma4